jgi:hypothetical protein
MASTLLSDAKTAAAGRSCGSCTLCCKVMSIAEIGKPHGAWCTHCRPGRGCIVYEKRPRECRTFNCAWLMDERLAPEWKPDRSKLVVTIAHDGNGIEIRCDPKFPQAWRQEPYRTRIREWSEGAERDGGSVVVLVGDRITLITPAGEFYLGVFSEDDVIVRDYSEGRLVGARLAKSASTSR